MKINIKMTMFVALLLLLFLFVSCTDNSNNESEHIHTFDEWVVCKKATLEEDGLYERTCHTCQEKRSLYRISL